MRSTAPLNNPTYGERFLQQQKEVSTFNPIHASVARALHANVSMSQSQTITLLSCSQEVSSSSSHLAYTSASNRYDDTSRTPRSEKLFCSETRDHNYVTSAQPNQQLLPWMNRTHPFHNYTAPESHLRRQDCYSTSSDLSRTSSTANQHTSYPSNSQTIPNYRSGDLVSRSTTSSRTPLRSSSSPWTQSSSNNGGPSDLFPLLLANSVLSSYSDQYNRYDNRKERYGGH